MKRSLQRIAASFAIVILANPLSTQDAFTSGPVGDGRLYYRIGGAQALGRPANRLANTTQIPMSLQLGINYRCGQFDPFASLGSAMDQVTNLLGHIDDLIAAGLAALPMYILQRVNPGLYDLLQNSLLRAEELVALSTKTCEQMEREIAQGKDPYEDWVVLSRGRDWKAVIGSGGVDVVKAKKEIDYNLGKSGVTWLCGQSRGGEGQEPIRVVYDVTRAGWNLLMNREVCASGGAGGGDDPPRIAALWSTPEAAADWTTKVIGDTVIRTTESNADGSQAGVGLINHHDKEAHDIEEQLMLLVNGGQLATIENLDKVSSPGTLISRQVIESIQARTPSEQPMLIAKLAGQVALERTVERALLARRMLLTGMRDPHVSATPAPKQLKSFLADLEREIDNLLFESRIRQDVSAHTAELLLRDERGRRTDSQGLVPAMDTKKLQEGGIKP
jgi:integrating conjugative element protein (TIGR03755 family)